MKNPIKLTIESKLLITVVVIVLIWALGSLYLKREFDKKINMNKYEERGIALIEIKTLDYYNRITPILNEADVKTNQERI